jgi:hypothetical protein
VNRVAVVAHWPSRVWLFIRRVKGRDVMHFWDRARALRPRRYVWEQREVAAVPFPPRLGRARAGWGQTSPAPPKAYNRLA